MPLKHSKLGIASFLIAFVSFIGLVASAAAASNAALALAENPNFDPSAISADDEVPEELRDVVLYSALMFFCVLSALGGALLGLIGLFRPERKKLFSVLGLALNGGLVLVVILMFVIGMLAAPALPI